MEARCQGSRLSEQSIVENVSGNKFYATLDLKDAYYQVMLDEESRSNNIHGRHKLIPV